MGSAGHRGSRCPALCPLALLEHERPQELLGRVVLCKFAGSLGGQQETQKSKANSRHHPLLMGCLAADLEAHEVQGGAGEGCIQDVLIPVPGGSPLPRLRVLSPRIRVTPAQAGRGQPSHPVKMSRNPSDP